MPRIKQKVWTETNAGLIIRVQDSTQLTSPEHETALLLRSGHDKEVGLATWKLPASECLGRGPGK